MAKKEKTTELDEKKIRAMFSNIASRYDLLNHIFSFGIDFYWWQQMAKRSGATCGSRFLDIAAGTCSSSLALTKRGAEVISTDFTSTMLKLGIDKFQHQDQDHPIWAAVEADAQFLPFKNNIFDGVTICYGIRNIKDRKKVYQECLRVLKPKGRFTILEFGKPKYQWLRTAYYIYISHVLPKIGRWVIGAEEAYIYLYESIQMFPNQQALDIELRNAGFIHTSWKDLTGGIVAIHMAQKPDYHF
jgi:demethylmenaquinone methyltransferase/2-methoxy-6-polyprenyl-1,4-benzoquinol methylase